VLKALRIDPKRSLEELNDDWTTSMELAETLQRMNQIPFRVGHHFASEVVAYAKAKDIKPSEFPYDQAVRIYAEAAGKYSVAQTKLPLDAATFKATLSPENMVRTRVGIGGPQPAEVTRMLGIAQQTVKGDDEWLAQRQTRLVEAQAKLNAAFQKLQGE
jgi:argininosuccinate lyase